MFKLLHQELKKKLNLKMIYIYTNSTKHAKNLMKITVTSHNYKQLKIIITNPILNKQINVIS